MVDPAAELQIDPAVGRKTQSGKRKEHKNNNINHLSSEFIKKAIYFSVFAGTDAFFFAGQKHDFKSAATVFLLCTLFYWNKQTVC